MKAIKTFYIHLIILTGVLYIISCKKFVQVPIPADQLSADLVFANDNTAVQAITGIYSQMMNDQLQFSSSLTTFYCGMSADEIYSYTPSVKDEFTSNQITAANHGTLEAGFWKPAYRYIYAANKCIDGANASQALAPQVKSMIIGEAKFIRSFCYFHLVNLFGDVPLVVSTNYEENQSIARTDAKKVNQQMISDLKEAEALLPATYPTTGRARPNKYAAAALLARIYLYNEDWANAETEATTVINSGMYSLPTDLNSVFLMTSNETIFQLKPVNPSRNSWEGNTIIPTSNSSTPTYLLTPDLTASFEAGDQRKNAWAKPRSFAGQTLYYPYKYKIKTGPVQSEYYVVLRLAEEYLIRAEARAMQNDISGAQADLNKIRTRAGLAATTANNPTDLLIAIQKERRTELFAEWGHRWFDLKRTRKADAVLGALKPATWNATDTLWPLPQSQINLNSSLTQNPGY
jgi:starch-binding outer membrane protein, SusD/RagB family